VTESIAQNWFYELTDSGGILLGTALEESFDLSFPFLFEYEGELYMCPETSQNRDIRIYRCIEFPLRWGLANVIMENVAAADTMLFPKDGRWWMLTNIDPAGIGDYCSVLFLFSAASPFDTSWKPHPLNPVIVDASRARNSGLFVDGDKILRFSQGQGLDFYGRRLLINEITELTEVSYRESCLSGITPSFGRGVVGGHHMHSKGERNVFDFVVSSTLATGGAS
jgi:hypothetical protein